MDLPEVRPGRCEDYLEFRTPPPDAAARSAAADAPDADDGSAGGVAGPFCGRTLPADFYSNGTGVLVTFTSNSIRERSGFRFRFERISYSVDLYAGNEFGDVIGQHGGETPAHSGMVHVVLVCHTPVSYTHLTLPTILRV